MLIRLECRRNISFRGRHGPFDAQPAHPPVGKRPVDALARTQAEQGDAKAFKLPRPLLHSGDLDFSFAGLKTAVLTQAKKLGDELVTRKADLAASTQAAIVEV